jgi:hypothetical protein
MQAEERERIRRDAEVLFATGDNSQKRHAETVMALIKDIDALVKSCEGLAAYISSENKWRFPLADSVTAEVTIRGTYSESHLKTFAKLFQAVSDNFVPAMEVTNAG